jgi:hypothetical protein
MHALWLVAEAGPEQLPWWLHMFQKSESLTIVGFIIAIICILIWALTTSIIRHRERMAMIQHGMNPYETREKEG